MAFFDDSRNEIGKLTACLAGDANKVKGVRF